MQRLYGRSILYTSYTTPLLLGNNIRKFCSDIHRKRTVNIFMVVSYFSFCLKFMQFRYNSTTVFDRTHNRIVLRKRIRQKVCVI